MIVRPITEAEAEAFSLLASKAGSVFHQKDWLDAMGPGLRRLGIFDEGNMLVGGFFYMEVRTFGWRLLRNPPFTPECGPFFLAEASQPSKVIERTRSMVTAVADFLIAQKRSVIYFALDKSIVDTLPFIWKSCKVTPNYTYQIDLTHSPETLWDNLAKGRRNDITKARKDGIVVRPTQDLGMVESFVHRTFARKDKSYPVEALHRILHSVAREDNSYAHVAEHEGVPIACTFVLHDRKTAYYLLSGFDETRRHHGAGALCLYESILHARERGCQVFDFEGSVIPSIEKYFRGFGGALHPTYVVTRAPLPVEMLLKFRHRELY